MNKTVLSETPHPCDTYIHTYVHTYVYIHVFIHVHMSDLILHASVYKIYTCVCLPMYVC